MPAGSQELPFGAPEGLELAEQLDARGRASRWAIVSDGASEGARRELWRLGDRDERVALRLRQLAEAGVGGFVDGGRDDDGPWLVRDLPARSLDQLRRDDPGPMPWAQAVSIVRQVARALAACEERSLFPGIVTPRAVVAEQRKETIRVLLPAEALVGAMVGAPAPRGGTDTGPKALLWSPPEKLDDALWDAASNRYALGVLLYELLAGRHPFGGAGLRHALAEARDAEAAPFAPEIARKLPAGLQSCCLRMLALDPERRPSSAAAIAGDLAAVMEAIDGVLADWGEPESESEPEPVSEPVDVAAIAQIIADIIGLLEVDLGEATARLETLRGRVGGRPLRDRVEAIAERLAEFDTDGAENLLRDLDQTLENY